MIVSNCLRVSTKVVERFSASVGSGRGGTLGS
jgi:hypothetical protein